MTAETIPGQIIILNGAPRAGKSSVAAAIQNRFDGPWMNLGVDAYAAATPPRYQPGIGLRPGGERPDLEAFIPRLYAALYESIAAHSRLGLNVVSDLGHHDGYSRPLGILVDCAKRLAGLPTLFVGARCPLDIILKRRAELQAGREGLYLSAAADASVPAPIRLWQEAVHRPGLYDLEIDTSIASPEQCAEEIWQHLRAGTPGPSAFERLALQAN